MRSAMCSGGGGSAESARFARRFKREGEEIQTNPAINQSINNTSTSPNKYTSSHLTYESTRVVYASINTGWSNIILITCLVYAVVWISACIPHTVGEGANEI